MIPADLHMHSSFSSDSDAPMERMIEAAIEAGLSYICFTEHEDYHYQDPTMFQLDPPRYWEKVTELKERYRDRITVLRGVELGIASDMFREGEELLSAYPFDFVIGSKHLMDGGDPYDRSFWEGRDREALLHRWFSQMRDDIEAYPVFDSLGHLDYVARYMPGGIRAFDWKNYEEEICGILKALIANDIALEVNTNSFRYGTDQPHPQTAVIEKYLEMGGSLITIGSDAHAPERVAQEFSRTEKILAEIGITQSVLYEGRHRIQLTFQAESDII